MIRSIKDFWAGLIYIFFGSSSIFVGRDYAMGTAFKMGPAYFPTILGSLLVLIGAISMIRSFIVSGTPITGFQSKGSAGSSGRYSFSGFSFAAPGWLWPCQY